MLSATPRWPALLAAAMIGAQALVLAGFVVFYLVELFQGRGSDVMRVLMEALLIAVFAAGLGVLAAGWWRQKSWIRTPTILWSLLLVPVAWGLLRGGQVPVGAAVLGSAALAVVGALASPVPPSSTQE